MTRKYEQRRRAQRQEETRQRIVKATVALHEDVGMLRTTVSDVASRAGVERATVYRHFPNEQALITACTHHYFSRFPPPDPEPWVTIIDPVERLRTGLTEIYAYHQLTEAMFARNLRDVPTVPAAREAVAPMFLHWGRVQEALASSWGPAEGDQARISALVGHAISFWTWHSLVREHGLKDDQAIEAMVRFVECLTQSDV